MTLLERFGRFYHSPDRGYREVVRRIFAEFADDSSKLPGNLHVWRRVRSALFL